MVLGFIGRRCLDRLQKRQLDLLIYQLQHLLGTRKLEQLAETWRNGHRRAHHIRFDRVGQFVGYGGCGQRVTNTATTATPTA